MGKFERGARVVIEAAHQSIIDCERYAHRAKNLLHLFEVGPAALIEEVADTRKLLDDGLIFWDFAVENAQWIRDRTALTVHAHLRRHGLERLAQCLIEKRAVVDAAYGIELQVPVIDAETIQKCGEQFDDFSIACGRLAPGRRRPDHFRANLVELAVTSLLWTLPPELRAHVKQLVESAFPQLMLDVSAHDSGRVLGTQGERLALLALGASAIFPCIHLLSDDVRFFTHRTREELRLFEDWRANLVKVVDTKYLTRCRFDKIPQCRVRRQQVASSSDSFNHFSR